MERPFDLQLPAQNLTPPSDSKYFTNWQLLCLATINISVIKQWRSHEAVVRHVQPSRKKPFEVVITIEQHLANYYIMSSLCPLEGSVHLKGSVACYQTIKKNTKLKTQKKG